MTVGIVYFPGTNCEHDLQIAIPKLGGPEPKLISHRDRELPADIDLLFVPGGFSFGDYLRTGAMAKVTPIMGAVRNFVDNGGTVVGICNGFQILCEAQLLPGVLLANRTTRFLSRPMTLKVEDTDNIFTQHMKTGDLVTVPIAHFEGNYFAEPEVLEELERENQVILRYAAPDGTVDADCPNANPNGSVNAIAGIRNKAGNVFGFMPHPERVLDVPLTRRFTQEGGKLLEGVIQKVAA